MFAESTSADTISELRIHLGTSRYRHDSKGSQTDTYTEAASAEVQGTWHNMCMQKGNPRKARS